MFALCKNIRPTLIPTPTIVIIIAVIAPAALIKNLKIYIYLDNSLKLFLPAEVPVTSLSILNSNKDSGLAVNS